jgi:hypothetical protein
MESLVDRLNSHAGEHAGTGGGRESGPFDATISLTPLLGRLGIAIHYRAVTPGGE